MNNKKSLLGDSPKNAPEFKLNPGSTSILLIFVTLCLVAFAVLCVVSSNSDRKLGGKVITRTGEYYAACNRAQELIADIDSELLTAYTLSEGDETAYFNSVGGASRTFVIDIDSKQKLYVELAIDYPADDNSPFYRIVGWKVNSGSSLDTVTIE
ncbi:MAG: hypothetical protein K5669_01020 [Lachnospiraceae bacterium]|nr:hypothetical protein [Lachnospiraceae bacterium]